MNSPLVSYTCLSPHKNSPRNHVIDTITIHCTAGHLSLHSLGARFAGSTRASSNYGIDDEGNVGLFVHENDRSWCSSSPENDHRAVTIEVSSDSKTPYAVTDAAYASLITLVADICKRNGIRELRWFNDPNLRFVVDKNGELKQNITLHKWFANKACPGPYLEERMFDIVAKVNALLQNREFIEKIIGFAVHKTGLDGGVLLFYDAN